MVLSIEKIGSERPWVARITGQDPKYGLSREFVNGVADYSGANSKRTRGVEYTFSLADGIYEVKGGTSWGSAGDRKFVRIIEEVIEKISMKEVLESF